MSTMKISIITITYNSENTLERAIESIVSQDYSNLEYIIVDGGSTDKTLDIIKKYGEKITKWVSEPDSGISNAFNKGIAMATGDIIGIINSDDGLLPGALEAISNAYSEGIDVYRGNVLLWKEDTDTKVIEIPSLHFTFTGLDRISHQSTFITKKAYEQYGVYDECCKYAMDYDLLYRFELAGAVFKYIDQTLAFYTLGGITFSPWTKERNNEIKYIMRKNGATNQNIRQYEVRSYIKRIIKKIIPKEIIMKIRNKKAK